MDYKDYYKLLGVGRNADEKEIKRAFRKLAVKYHPDKNPGDKQAEERFKEINEAYEVLGDTAKRAKYDQLGSSYQDWQRMGGQSGGFDWTQWASTPGGTRVEVGDLNDLFGGGFSDFFNTIFGGMGGTGQSFAGRVGGRGRDLEQAVPISLAEAYSGAKRTVQRGRKRLEVKVPAGAQTGTRVRIAGQGEGSRSQSGDLYLVVEVEPDARFERKGDDLTVDATVDLYTAVLGGETEVPTPVGDVVLTIPPESQPGQVFRLKGRGMPNLRNPSTHGDLFARLKVTLPAHLSEEERELYRRLAGMRKG
jgi:curved DNA-binding protein